MTPSEESAINALISRFGQAVRSQALCKPKERMYWTKEIAGARKRLMDHLKMEKFSAFVQGHNLGRKPKRSCFG